MIKINLQTAEEAVAKQLTALNKPDLGWLILRGGIGIQCKNPVGEGRKPIRTVPKYS